MLVSAGGLNEGSGEVVTTSVTWEAAWVAVGGMAVNVGTGELNTAVPPCSIVAVGASSPQMID